MKCIHQNELNNANMKKKERKSDDLIT